MDEKKLREMEASLKEEMGEEKFMAFRMILDTLIGLALASQIVPPDSPAQDFFRKHVGEIVNHLVKANGPMEALQTIEMVNHFVEPMVQGAREGMKSPPELGMEVPDGPDPKDPSIN